jgi:hypothetical protein
VSACERTASLHLCGIAVAAHDVVGMPPSVTLRFNRLDFLFCNAGVMNITGHRWWVALHSVLLLSFRHFLETGRCGGVRGGVRA